MTDLLRVVPNLYCFDVLRNIWRGGYPLDWTVIKKLGIEKDVKLNTEDEGPEQGAIDLGIQVFRCPIPLIEQVFTEPDESLVQQALQFIDNNTYIHCGSVARSQETPDDEQPDTRGGNDRTSYVIGRWRVLNGWPKAKARAEMDFYRFHWLEFGLDRAWIEKTANLP